MLRISEIELNGDGTTLRLEGRLVGTLAAEVELAQRAPRRMVICAPGTASTSESRVPAAPVRAASPKIVLRRSCS